MQEEIGRIDEMVKAESAFIDGLLEEIRRVIVGQYYLVERLLIGLLADGHILIEGVPGLAKTLSVQTLASAVKAEFRRIQFTPDLLPADLVGTLIYNQQEGAFKPRLGPVFANVVLADEINRAPAKVQSALLEAMQERQVTIGGTTYPLPVPFLVLATQNPIEQEGTYPLPEAQVDRFMLKLHITYPSREEERAILDRMAPGEGIQVEPRIGAEEILKAREMVRRVYVDERIKGYVVELVMASRSPERFGLERLKGLIRYGASPRATIYLVQAAQAHAFIRRRGYVTPEDVKAIAPDVLRHRVLLSYEAEAEERTPDDLVADLLGHIEVP